MEEEDQTLQEPTKRSAGEEKGRKDGVDKQWSPASSQIRTQRFLLRLTGSCASKSVFTFNGTTVCLVKRKKII